jgi:DNA-binding NarL/FixJ family response regulator
VTTPTTGSAVRVVIADDHPVVRDGLRVLINSIAGLTLVGEADTGTEAVRLAVTLKPDVVIMDLEMPQLDGIAATRQILRALPGTAVLVLTMFEDDDKVHSALRAGARGYLLKGALQDDIIRAISAVAGGGAVFGAEVAARVINQLADPPPTAPPPFPRLTAREREVLDHLAAGLPTRSIAARLTLSEKTVANHLSTILTKLGLATRAEAIVIARDAGLGRGAD